MTVSHPAQITYNENWRCGRKLLDRRAIQMWHVSGGGMLRVIFWSLVFLLGASMVAVQPAYLGWQDKPVAWVKNASHFKK